MALTPETADILNAIFRRIGFIILYAVIGFGPGLVIGIMLANRMFGRGKPIYMQVHEENIQKAIEHNKQWHPEQERWKES